MGVQRHHSGVDIKKEYIDNARSQIEAVNNIISGVDEGLALTQLCRDNNIDIKKFRRLWLNNCLFKDYSKADVDSLLYYCLSWQERLFLHLIRPDLSTTHSIVSTDMNTLIKIPKNINDNMEYAISYLKPDYADVLLLYWRDDLVYEEVGRRLSINKARAQAVNEKACDKLRSAVLMNLIRLGKDTIDYINSERERQLKQDTCDCLKSNIDLSSPLSVLGLSQRPYKALTKQGVETLSDLVQFSRKELLSFKNLGDVSYYEIEHKLFMLGLFLSK